MNENDRNIESDSFGNTINLSKIKSNNKTQLIYINDLPNEILIQILSQLDPLILNELRLVCKKWNFIINDKETWTKSFQIRFGINPNSSSFPNVTNSNNWMNEYFTRLNILRNWKKGHSIHQSYKILNNEYNFNDFTMCDFKMNKLIIFDKRSGNISSGNLDSGKNQNFIPGDFNLNTLSFAMNWNYLILGKINGDIILKNLITSTSLSQRVSSTKFIIIEEERSPIMDIIINQYVDKNKISIDIISGSYNGLLQCWSLNGQCKNKVELDEPIYNIKSDFNKFIIVNTAYHLYVLDFDTLNILNKVDLGITINDGEHIHLEQLINQKNTLDVDYGGKNIILSYKSTIKVFSFHGIGIRKLDLEDGVIIIESKFQTCNSNKLINMNDNVIGKDGLFYGNLLSDNSIIIWNIRDESTNSIIPQYRLYPELNYKKVSNTVNNIINNNELMKITTFEFNSSILAISGYNGLTNIYDIFTGKFLREASIKFPKKFDNNDILRKTSSIKLNPNNLNSNGLIICGDCIQYFQFGKLLTSNDQPNSIKKNSKQLNLGTYNNNKHELKNKINDEINEYNEKLNQQQQTNRLFNKYNGTQYDDEEEEMRIALAMSENLENFNNTNNKLNEFDEDLKLALELSLIDNNNNRINQ
ncbi:hypothetical protein KGF54_001146 [Candida jiufengensis]|uniref:uncharacterized protein n=1 Tax=Candida jiufengensis TaxID=497108 RepID=UPI002224C67B|nr:uncharacterized protein KGF54_001146 [Candida jiufengensis]KAI5955644.1 hypothetical protein KGF54_001146 [Candida jiufengensis]